MRTRQLLITGLLVAACASPAAANYFSNPATNTMLNVGSAPSPTPEQLRLIGDSYLVGPRAELSDMVGKDVYGKNREFLGKIRSVDEVGLMADMQLPTGVVITIATADLVDRNDRVIAPNMSRGDVIALADRQGARTAPIEVSD
jgi:hypothetical protein